MMPWGLLSLDFPLWSFSWILPRISELQSGIWGLLCMAGLAIFPSEFRANSERNPSSEYHPHRNVYKINSQNICSGHVTHYMTRKQMFKSFSGHAISFTGLNLAKINYMK